MFITKIFFSLVYEYFFRTSPQRRLWNVRNFLLTRYFKAWRPSFFVAHSSGFRKNIKCFQNKHKFSISFCHQRRYSWFGIKLANYDVRWGWWWRSCCWCWWCECMFYRHAPWTTSSAHCSPVEKPAIVLTFSRAGEKREKIIIAFSLLVDYTWKSKWKEVGHEQISKKNFVPVSLLSLSFSVEYVERVDLGWIINGSDGHMMVIYSLWGILHIFFTVLLSTAHDFVMWGWLCNGGEKETRYSSYCRDEVFSLLLG